MLYRALRRGTIAKALLGQEPFYRIETRRPLEHHGSSYGGWSIIADSLHHDSVVYSFGIGTDASFDLSLIATYQCQIHAFDPTPESREWVAKHVSSPLFLMNPLALADSNRPLRFYCPAQDVADQVSASASATPQSNRYFEAEGKTLNTLMHERGHTFCDVLKMDIEGMEYSVLSQLAAEGCLTRVGQVLVEFHHFLDGLGSQATRNAVRLLREHGFQIAWISRTNHEYLFVRRAS